jgi:hypothetical protein
VTDIAAQEQPAGVDLIRIQRDKDFLSFLKTNFDMCANMRRSFEQQWYTNLAFYMGRQWVTWAGPAINTTGGFSLIEPPAPRWRVRLVSNKIKPLVRNEFTKLTKEEPQFYVKPATNEEEDLAAARAAETINEFLMDQMRFNRRRRQATLWTCITGVGFLKTYYDEGVKLPDGSQGSTVLDCVTPFHLFVPDLQAEDIEAQPFITQAGGRTPQQLKDTYGVEVKPDSNMLSGIFEQRLQGVMGIKNVGQNKNMVYVKETWIKPCGKFPQGKMVVWCDTQIIYESEAWPYQHGHYPFVKIDHVPIPGRFYGSSVIDDVIPIQKEFNKTRSQLIESKNRMSMPQLISPKGSVDPKKITSEPGLIIEYQPGFQPPQPLTLQSPPGYVIQELDRLQQDIDDLSGQYEITKGRTPPGVEAASAIAYLQEENDTRMYHTVASIEEAVQEIGFQVLNLVQEFWDEERMVSVVSQNSAYEAQVFKGSNLKGNVDLRVETQSMAPRSRAARQAFITELMKMGAIPMDKGLQYLQMSDLSSLYAEMQIDKRQAQRENWKMAQTPVGLDVPGAMGNGMQNPALQKLGLNMPTPPVGSGSALGMDMQTPDPMALAGLGNGNGMPMQPPPPLPTLPTNDFDNDDAHILEHENYMKSQEYEALPPEVQQVFITHLMEHRQKQFQLQMSQQDPSGAQQNAGPGSNVQPGSNGSVPVG